MNDEEPDFRGLNVPGYIYLKIRARDTEANNFIFQRFRQLALTECDNDYTQAMAKLLEYYAADAKVELLWEAIQALSARVEALEDGKDRRREVMKDERF